jgi:hypothetical protein
MGVERVQTVRERLLKSQAGDGLRQARQAWRTIRFITGGQEPADIIMAFERLALTVAGEIAAKKGLEDPEAALPEAYRVLGAEKE